jgi:hypothetical protein
MTREFTIGDDQLDDDDVRPKADDGPEILECRVGSWYFKRMILMASMLGVFAAWFFYDGTVGYAKKNRAALSEEAFAAGGAGVPWAKFASDAPNFVDMNPGPEVTALVKAAHAAGTEPIPWTDYARKNGIPETPVAGSPESKVKEAFAAGKLAAAEWEAFANLAGVAVDPAETQDIALKRAFESAGQKREFAGYAASLGFDSKDNKYHSKKDILEQLVIAGVCGTGALVALLFLVLSRGRVLKADREAIILPDGRRVPFAAAYRIDKRKWDNKGLAYVHYREGREEKKAVIDDLKFVGAGKILDRLMAGFSGALVESAADVDGEESDPGIKVKPASDEAARAPGEGEKS